MLMNSRLRLRETLSFSPGVPPPRYESEFSDEVVQAWRTQGALSSISPEEYFHLDRREDLPVAWRRAREEKTVVETESDMTLFRRTYDPRRTDRLPSDWDDQLSRWVEREFALSAAPWNEGFFQVIGISDAVSFNKAIALLYDQPKRIEAAMDHYAGYLEELMNRVLADVEVDYAVFYEPIASNHAPVVSPETYARFAMPALRRVVECIDRRGVEFRFVWSSGQVRPLIPLWLDAGINGLLLNQPGLAGISYRALRREFDSRLRFLGGVDWRVVVQGPQAIDEELEQTVRPLLEQGGYVPYLDDTIRAYIPFDQFRYYRDRLDKLVAEVYGCPP